VTDISAAYFYCAALTPLRYSPCKKHENTVISVAFSRNNKLPDFWIHKDPPPVRYAATVNSVFEAFESDGRLKVHVAFKAKSQKVVREFWEAGL